MSVEIAWKQNILVTDSYLLKLLLVVFGFGLQAFVCDFSRQNICSVLQEKDSRWPRLWYLFYPVTPLSVSMTTTVQSRTPMLFPSAHLYVPSMSGKSTWKYEQHLPHTLLSSFRFLLRTRLQFSGYEHFWFEATVCQSYIYQVLQTIQMKLILLCVWAEPAVLDSTKTALKFKYKI